MDLKKRDSIKFKKYFNISDFIPVDVKNPIKKLVLNMGCFLKIVKIQGTTIGETDTAPKKKNKAKQSIFNF